MNIFKSRTVLWVLVLVAVIAIIILTLDTQAEPAERVNPELSTYFQEEIINRGISDIGHPIEGFSADSLILAYPGLMPDDFDEVEAFEGIYTVVDGEAVFTRNVPQPITSAEQTISEDGYATLLENLITRFDVSLESKEDIDELIEKIDTGERVEVKINEEGSAFGVRVTPLEVLEDSRCPMDADCIQEGTVRVSTTLMTEERESEQVFELGETVETNGMQITLIQVVPFTETGEEIEEGEYIFFFEVVKSSGL